MGKISPPDPRNLLPSRADPEHRGHRKELEKKHGYGFTEPLILAAIGVGLLWNVENQVKKHEERKDEDEKRKEERAERRRRRREEEIRSGTFDPRADRGSERERGRDRNSRGGRGDGGCRDESRSYYRDDYSRGNVPRQNEYHRLEYRGYRDDYRDYKNDYRYEDRRDGSLRRSSRRDSF